MLKALFAIDGPWITVKPMHDVVPICMGWMGKCMCRSLGALSAPDGKNDAGNGKHRVIRLPAVFERKHFQSLEKTSPGRRLRI
jgi:hypothetical protein